MNGKKIEPRIKPCKECKRELPIKDMIGWCTADGHLIFVCKYCVYGTPFEVLPKNEGN
ncbi:MAG: hypothetical protein FWD76_02750 [Firmicutes bacterium]|nr:hypothetical protein [Bacillota bacterium]